MLKVFKLPSRRKRKDHEATHQEALTARPLSASTSSSSSAQSLTVAPTLDLNLPSPSFSTTRNNTNNKDSPVGADPLGNTPSRSSLWVDVSTPPSTSTSAQSHLQDQQQQQNPPPSHLHRSATTHRRLKAKLAANDVASLVEASAAQLKARGLEELGLFRPYRWAEDAPHQRRLQDLFLRAVQDDLLLPPSDDHSHLGDDPAQDFLSAARRPSDLFAEQLQSAGAHDLAALVKWSLRHLASAVAEPKSFSAGQPMPWLEAASSATDHNAYPTFADTLAEGEARLLASLMDLVAAVAAYAEANAMSASRLCKVFGFWVLAPKSTAYDGGYQQFYDTWKRSTNHFERLFLAYLRAQPSLPRRLQEILDRSGSTLLPAPVQPALQAVYSLPAPAGRKTGAHGQGSLRQRAKSCAELFNHALSSTTHPTETEHPSEPIVEEWWQILVGDAVADGAQADQEHNKYARILAEDSARIIALVDPPPGAARQASTGPSAASPTRRRSLTIDAPPAAAMTRSQSSAPGISFATSFPNHSAKELPRATSTPHMDSASAPSWSQFVSTGFAFDQGREGMNLNLSPSAAPEDKQAPAQRAKKLEKKSHPPPPEQDVKATTTPQPAEEKAVPPHPQGQLKVVRLVDVEDAFADVYLDVMAETEIRAKWPNFAIALLKKPLGACRSEPERVKWLVVEEVEPAPSPVPSPASSETPTPVDRATSPTRSTASGRERRHFFSRFSGVFSSSEGKKGTPGSPQKGKKTAPTNAPPPPVLEAIPQSPDTAEPMSQQIPSEPNISQQLQAPPPSSPFKGAEVSQGSSQSSLKSIKRVKPPSANELFAPSTNTDAEVASTTAIRHLSPGGSTVNINATDATETLQETTQKDTESIIKTSPEVKEEALTTLAAAEAQHHAGFDNPATTELLSASQPEPPREEGPVPAVYQGKAAAMTETAHDAEPDSKKSEERQSVERPSSPSPGLAESRVSTNEDAAEDTPASQEKAEDFPIALEPDSKTVEEKESVRPSDNRQKPQAEAALVQAASLEEPAVQQPVTPKAANTEQQDGSEPAADAPIAASSTEQTPGPQPQPDAQGGNDEPRSEAEGPVEGPSASPKTPTLQVDTSHAEPKEVSLSNSPELLRAQDSISNPRRSPSAESLASQTSNKSDHSESKRSKKLVQGAKKIITVPFRKKSKSSSGSAAEAREDTSKPALDDEEAPNAEAPPSVTTQAEAPPAGNTVQPETAPTPLSPAQTQGSDQDETVSDVKPDPAHDIAAPIAAEVPATEPTAESLSKTDEGVEQGEQQSQAASDNPQPVEEPETAAKAAPQELPPDSIETTPDVMSGTEAEEPPTKTTKPESDEVPAPLQESTETAVPKESPNETQPEPEDATASSIVEESKPSVAQEAPLTLEEEQTSEQSRAETPTKDEEEPTGATTPTAEARVPVLPTQPLTEENPLTSTSSDSPTAEKSGQEIPAASPDLGESAAPSEFVTPAATPGDLSTVGQGSHEPEIKLDETR